MAYLLRELSVIAIVKHFTFTATFIPGKENKKADSLSRFDFQAFFAMAPEASLKSLQVPKAVLNRLVFPPWSHRGKYF